MAAPSLRNSGLLATSNAGRSICSAGRCAALVPTGTVLLITTMALAGQVRGNVLHRCPERGRLNRTVVRLGRAHAHKNQFSRLRRFPPGGW